MELGVAQFLSGALAGVIALLALHWLESIKLLQQQGHVPWADIAREPARLYAGLGPALLETAAYNGLQFGFYELFKLRWQLHYGVSPAEVLPQGSAMLVGLAAGSITQCCTSPLKVVAMRLAGGLTGESTTLEVVRNVWREGGVAAFFRGNMSGLAAQPLVIALSFFFFERLRLPAETVLGTSVLVVVLVGGVANCLSIVAAYPLRIAKDKLQSQRDGQYSGLLDVWAQSYGARGLGGLYAGLSADLASAFVKRGLTFWCKEAVLELLLDNAAGSGIAKGDL